MIDRERIHEQIDRIRAYLREMRPYSLMDYQEYISSNEHVRTVERLLQLVVDTAVEMNSHLLVESGRPAPQDYRTSFIDLERIHVLSSSFARSIALSTGLRNLLVHDYAEVDAQRVYESVPQALKEYEVYCKEVLRFLKRSKQEKK